MDVVDPVREGTNELNGVDKLPVKVTWVKVKPKLGPVVDRFKGTLSRVDVERNFGRVNFEAELNSVVAEDVQNRVPLFGEIVVAGVDHGVGNGWEAVKQVPDGRTCEAIDDLHAQLGGGLCRILHLLDGTGANTFRATFEVVPDVLRQDKFMAFVDDVANCLADEVIRDGPALQAVFGQKFVAALAVTVFVEGLLNIEVVAPARQFDAFIAPCGGFFGDIFDRHVGPLACEKCNWTSHGDLWPFFDFAGKVLCGDS